MSIIFVAALVLNAKTFLVLLKRKRHHRNVVTIFLLNLTLVSALMMSQVPFNIYAIIEQGWIFGNGFCQFNGFSNVFLCMNLIFTLVCLTIDRYLAVTKSLQHRTIMSRRTAYYMLVVVYVLSFLLAIVPILGKAKYEYHPGTNHCSPAWANSCGYAAAMTTIAFVLPILGMLITYTRIFLTLRDKRVLMSKNSTSTISSREIQDVDSNSLGFEDTSTYPPGDCNVRLTVLKTLVHSNDGVLGSEIGASLENLVHKDSTMHQNAEGMRACGTVERSTEHLVSVAVDVSRSDDYLEEKTHAKETWPSNECPTNKQLEANDIKENNRQSASDDMEGTSLESKNDKANKSHLKLEEKRSVNTSVTDTDEPEIPRSELSVPNSSEEVATKRTEKVTPDAAINSSDHESDVCAREETRIAENKQVSFQNSLKVNPSESKDESKKRLSNILPASRKVMRVLVCRLKRQRAIRHEYKIARTGTILVVTFLILWMPYVIAHLCFARDCRTMTFYSIATFLVYTNALANPVIYALTNRAVMQDIRNSMGRFCQSK